MTWRQSTQDGKFHNITGDTRDDGTACASCGRRLIATLFLPPAGDPPLGAPVCAVCAHNFSR
ncbi:hypothetical protein LX83_003731 [Goodfellowiella coeruleoviolacea]|uniref:Uncharacterized protein n=1 Tax=Goodfellowiella coeruleoviolacea TaxID=334858 RepID=A0AAE3GGG4_9PSEU|nr:hypothetical protein [Goodfellowiella coeruleoviolacea]